jgi:DnaJ-class molecular chaperone
MGDGDPLDKLDYYTLLGVADDARVDAVRKAFHLFALKYHPDRHAAAAPEKRDRAAVIYRRGAEAYRVLQDAEQRRQYDAQLAAGKVRFDAEEAAKQQRVTNPGSSVLMIGALARPFWTKADQAIRAGDLKTARLNLQIALKHEPQSALLTAKLATVEQQLKAPK